MHPTTSAAITHIYEQWHHCVINRDLDGLTALYDAEAVFETPLVLVADKERHNGILKGKEAIKAFFEAGFQSTSNGLGKWYRTGQFYSNGQQLVWEYPRETPDGDQTDLVEIMDTANGLITHHRVYWGWKGFQALTSRL